MTNGIVSSNILRARLNEIFLVDIASSALIEVAHTTQGVNGLNLYDFILL